jgi:hypothetical protein
MLTFKTRNSANPFIIVVPRVPEIVKNNAVIGSKLIVQGLNGVTSFCSLSGGFRIIHFDMQAYRRLNYILPCD